MRTGRALTVSRGGGVPAWRGGCLPGGGGACLERGCLPGGGVPAWRGGACLPGGGVPAWRGGACLEGGVVPAWRGGACLPGGGVPAWRGGTWRPPPVDRITDACKNITLAKTSFRPVKTLTSCTEGSHLEPSLPYWIPLTVLASRSCNRVLQLVLWVNMTQLWLFYTKQVSHYISERSALYT